jgi:hypothetical protein
VPDAGLRPTQGCALLLEFCGAKFHGVKGGGSEGGDGQTKFAIPRLYALGGGLWTGAAVRFYGGNAPGELSICGGLG